MTHISFCFFLWHSVATIAFDTPLPPPCAATQFEKAKVHVPYLTLAYGWIWALLDRWLLRTLTDSLAFL